LPGAGEGGSPGARISGGGAAGGTVATGGCGDDPVGATPAC